MDFIHIRVTKAMRQLVKVEAATLGKSITQFVGEMINEYFERKGNLN